MDIKKISVTGTPGTGKTEVSRQLSVILDYNYIDLNQVVDEEGLVSGFDKRRKTKEVDPEKLKELEIPKNSVVDGHLSHHVPGDLVVVLRTRPDILKKRLVKKGWSASKVQENLEAEILGICSYEAREENKRVVEIETTNKKPLEVAKEIKKMIDKKKLKTREIDWLEDYSDMIGE